ncbi:MAG: cytochrome c biogenesis protein CcsA [Polyangiaceae bacterium]|nr:cytochrome c biogenesis protein CcsA [Polyangiaceae bacterium]
MSYRPLMSRNVIGPSVLLAVTALLFSGLIPFVFLATPAAQPVAGGLAQKVFYFHVPAAYAMYLAGTACFVGSTFYLWRESDGRDAVARAAAEVAVVFGAMVLTSGPLWAKKAWGVYWTWDPRLTTALLSWAVYVAVVLIRRFGGEGGAERRFAATLGVLGWFNLWLIHLSVQLWGGNHPTVISSGGGGLAHPVMRIALGFGFVAMTLLAATLIWVRARLHLQADRLEHAEHQAIAADLLVGE